MENAINNRIKILITEEDPDNQKLILLYFRKYFDITPCYSSDEFYDLLNKDKYDLILMDISIRGAKNGLELTRELKRNPAYAKIPVLCYTAHALYQDRLNALEAGCDAYLSKPSDLKTLLVAIIDLLKTSGKTLTFDIPAESYSFS
ncbi:response regulator [Melioribacteraceae bacterium 4301-Me]|uniref:response regulator n=1 Tax=Pyranulibacter aquaticus TaxID=3163344 RepID=UPI00359B3E6A